MLYFRNKTVNKHLKGLFSNTVVSFLRKEVRYFSTTLAIFCKKIQHYKSFILCFTILSCYYFLTFKPLDQFWHLAWITFWPRVKVYKIKSKRQHYVEIQKHSKFGFVRYLHLLSFYQKVNLKIPTWKSPVKSTEIEKDTNVFTGLTRPLLYCNVYLFYGNGQCSRLSLSTLIAVQRARAQTGSNHGALQFRTMNW